MADEVIVADGELMLRTRPAHLRGPTSRHGVQWYNYSSGHIDTKNRWCTCNACMFVGVVHGDKVDS